MGGKGRRLLEWGKTALIVLLACSALYLVGRTQIYYNLTRSAAGGWLAPLLALVDGDGGGLIGGAQSQEYAPNPETARPLRMVITNEDGSYGVQYSAGIDEVYEAVGSLLAEAVGAARAPRAVWESEWRRALRAPGVYFDFLGEIPLSALSEWLSGEENTALLSGRVRRMCLASLAGGPATLYYINEEDGLYYACEIATDLLEHLERAIDEQTPNGAAYAFSSDGAFESLYPYTLILPTPPRGENFASISPLGAISADTVDEPLAAVLTALTFHPQVNSVYSVPGGLVVREGNDALRVTERGDVSYFADGEGEARFPVVGQGDTPTCGEILSAARGLAERTVGALCGSARLYLMGMEETERGYTVHFGYALDGAAVQLYDEGYAARFEIEGDRITGITLRLRTYTSTGEHSLILPEIQAAAAVSALGGKGGELLLRYEDMGGALVTASWGV